MNDELFEVAFTGRINDGADLSQVKARIARMFNADETRIAHLFSGKRIVIKKNIDLQTANKYQVAIAQAGAECEVKSNAADTAVTPRPVPTIKTATPARSRPSTSGSVKPAAAANTRGTGSADPGDLPSPPKTDPLGIRGDQIEVLSATIAPVGSELQDDIKEFSAPQIDISNIQVAPLGSDIGSGKKKPESPPPDTSGMSMSD